MKETLKRLHLKKILEAERGDEPAQAPEGPGADRRTQLGPDGPWQGSTNRARPLTGRVRPDDGQGRPKFSIFVF